MISTESARSKLKMEINTILFATDFSAISENAMKVASNMAQRHHAKLIIVHVVRAYFSVDRAGNQMLGSDLIQQNIDRASEKIQFLKKSLQEKFQLQIETHICTDSIVVSLNNLVNAKQADVVVMGTAGHQKMKEFILGSISYQVLLHVHCSVLLVPAQFRKTNFKKILFPVRVQKNLDHKANFSILLAQKNSGAINLLGVGSPDQSIAIRTIFIDMKKKLFMKSANYSSEFKLTKDNAETIAKIANERECDIIILANKDENIWRSFFGENFFRKMINTTHVPLLIVKEKSIM